MIEAREAIDALEEIKAIKASDAIDTSDATSASEAIGARKKFDAFEASVRRYSKSIGAPEAIEASNDRNDRHNRGDREDRREECVRCGRSMQCGHADGASVVGVIRAMPSGASYKLRSAWAQCDWPGSFRLEHLDPGRGRHVMPNSAMGVQYRAVGTDRRGRKEPQEMCFSLHTAKA